MTISIIYSDVTRIDKKQQFLPGVTYIIAYGTVPRS